MGIQTGGRKKNCNNTIQGKWISVAAMGKEKTNMSNPRQRLGKNPGKGKSTQTTSSLREGKLTIPEGGVKPAGDQGPGSNH